MNKKKICLVLIVILILFNVISYGLILVLKSKITKNNLANETNLSTNNEENIENIDEEKNTSEDIKDPEEQEETETITDIEEQSQSNIITSNESVKSSSNTTISNTYTNTKNSANIVSKSNTNTNTKSNSNASTSTNTSSTNTTTSSSSSNSTSSNNNSTNTTTEETTTASIYDYPFDIDAIKKELITVGENLGLTHITSDDGVKITPSNSSWTSPITARKSLQGANLEKALKEYVSYMPTYVYNYGGGIKIKYFTIYVEDIGNGSYTFYFLY